MIIAFLVGVLAVAFLIMAVVSRPAPSAKPKKKLAHHHTTYLDREFVARKWDMVEKMSQGGGSLRDAVSEADKLLDYALKHSGVRGETMGERLRYSGKRFTDIDAIWRAHKVRNALAHDATFDLVPEQAREAIRDLKQGLKDLGAL